MKSNVPVAEAIKDEEVLPERVREALGELVGAAKEGLLALSVEVGLGVLHELLELEVDEIVGPKGRWNRDRTAVRHGHEGGEVTLGGRRVGVKHPRVRTADGESEVSLETYEHFAGRDQLGRLAPAAPQPDVCARPEVPRWWIAHLALVRRSDVGLPTPNAGFGLAGRALLLGRAEQQPRRHVPTMLVLLSWLVVARDVVSYAPSAVQRRP